MHTTFFFYYLNMIKQYILAREIQYSERVATCFVSLAILNLNEYFMSVTFYAKTRITIGNCKIKYFFQFCKDFKVYICLKLNIEVAEDGDFLYVSRQTYHRTDLENMIQCGKVEYGLNVIFFCLLFLFGIRSVNQYTLQQQDVLIKTLIWYRTWICSA